MVLLVTYEFIQNQSMYIKPYKSLCGYKYGCNSIQNMLLFFSIQYIFKIIPYQDQYMQRCLIVFKLLFIIRLCRYTKIYFR